jgi:hypothetical protein
VRRILVLERAGELRVAEDVAVGEVGEALRELGVRKRARKGDHARQALQRVVRRLVVEPWVRGGRDLPDSYASSASYAKNSPNLV